MLGSGVGAKGVHWREGSTGFSAAVLELDAGPGGTHTSADEPRTLQRHAYIWRCLRPPAARPRPTVRVLALLALMCIIFIKYVLLVAELTVEGQPDRVAAESGSGYPHAAALSSACY